MNFIHIWKTQLHNIELPIILEYTTQHKRCVDCLIGTIDQVFHEHQLRPSGRIGVMIGQKYIPLFN